MCHAARRGFSLIEIIFTLGIFCIAVGCSLFFSMDSYRSHSFFDDRDALVSLLQHARSQAMANVCSGNNCTTGVAHGVHIDTTHFIIFQGASYEARDAAQDDVVDASPLVFHSGNTDVVFEPLSGDVLSPGTIHLTDAAGHKSIITVGDRGQITWTN